MAEDEEQATIRVRIEVSEWQEFDVTDDWFAGEVDNDPDALWAAVADLYTKSDPALAWEATEGDNSRVVVHRVGTDEVATTDHERG